MARQFDRSGNPTMRVMSGASPVSTVEERMTVNGTIAKTGIMFLLLLISAGWSWHRFFSHVEIIPGAGIQGHPMAAVGPFMLIGLFGGLILALATCFKPNWAHITAPLYAILEGLFVGAFSALLTLRFGPVVFHAVLLTLGVMFTMLTLYTTGIIKVTQKFRMGVIAATGGVLIFYLATWVMGMVGVHTGSLFYGGGTTSIVISLAILGIAALNLVLDFDFIEQQSKRGVPKQFEWYGAFALTVTLIWLYLEALRLMANLNGR